ncbi:response regulator transcription factor [Roseivivax sp. THAF40]|uniref:response regulator transcription factor n=1 Tax=Roseivivax sp. THAF40 TaxID=2587858 RepID=UPI001269096D|nr:response regulator transcription factor [Roseivivax sp. THAF40]
MHVFLHATTSDKGDRLTRELKKAGVTALPVDAKFFQTDHRTLRARASDRAPFLLTASENTLDHIRAIRAAECASPILVLRETRDAFASSAVLDAGADDDLVAPIKMVELLSRINSIARRAAGHSSESITLGEAEIFFDGRHPEFCGHKVPLSRREYAIFHELALAGGRCVSKRALYDAVYGMSDDQPFDKVIDVYICKLRKKFSNASTFDHPYIETVHGRGYKLTEPEFRSVTAAE